MSSSHMPHWLLSPHRAICRRMLPCVNAPPCYNAHKRAPTEPTPPGACVAPAPPKRFPVGISACADMGLASFAGRASPESTAAEGSGSKTFAGPVELRALACRPHRVTFWGICKGTRLRSPIGAGQTRCLFVEVNAFGDMTGVSAVQGSVPPLAQRRIVMQTMR